jgi:hypothetical protein
MRRLSILLMLSACIVTTGAWAQDNQVNDNENPSLSSTAGSKEVTRGYLSNEVVGLKPQLGVMVFTDQNGNSTSRALGGIGIEANIATMISQDLKSVYFGPSTGFLYSHLGSTGSNFVGTNPEGNASGSAGANLLIIPANMKLAYNITDGLRIGGHGGGNVVYRSDAASLNLGDSSSVPGSVWRIFPNAGADAEFGLGKNVALTLRPDWTFTPGDNFFTGTVALNIPIS